MFPYLIETALKKEMAELKILWDQFKSVCDQIKRKINDKRYQSVDQLCISATLDGPLSELLLGNDVLEEKMNTLFSLIDDASDVCIYTSIYIYL